MSGTEAVKLHEKLDSASSVAVKSSALSEANMLEAAEQMAKASAHVKAHSKNKAGAKVKAAAKGMIKSKNKDDMFAQIDNSVEQGMMMANVGQVQLA